MSDNTPDSDHLLKYLDSFLTDESISEQSAWKRARCCGSSRSLYCPECCRIVVPFEEWPEPIRERRLKLPFDLDLVLHDRRKSSSGLQAVTLLRAANQESRVRLLDVEKGDAIPCYNEDGVYFLYPSPDESVPLQEVAPSVKRLIVLDCKWTRTSTRLHPSLSKLPKVHLSLPANIKSHFWRWHNAGPGMLSTLEAIYYAALEVNREQQQQRDLIYITWLFGLQRAAIQRHVKSMGGELPYSDAGKEEQRALRRRSLEQRQLMKAEARHRATREKQGQEKTRVDSVSLT